MSSPSTPPQQSLTVIEVAAPGMAAYTLDAAANMAGIHPDMLRYYCQLGLLGEKFQHPAEEPRFDDNTLYELGWIEYYRNHHGVNRQALTVIFELRRDLQRLQDEVRFLRGM
jgi:DNA-binding transcriptional MerR regulator